MVWVLNQTARQKRRIEREATLLSSRLQDLDLAETNLKQLKRVLTDTRSDLQRLNERIPVAAGLGDLIKQVDTLIKSRQIVLVSLMPLAPQILKRYTRIPIRLVLKGTFQNIFHLLNDLEQMTRLIVMERLIISDGDARLRQAEVTFTVFERSS